MNIFKMSKEYVIYLIVRNDLKMGKGKMAAQCGHAVQQLLEKCPKPLYQDYMKCGYPKIVLKINREVELLTKWEKVKKFTKQHALVVDAGKTQLQPNTITVLGIGPIEKYKVKNIVSELKLM